MAAITVSAPDAVSKWVQRRIESGEYASASDYLLDLIRRDRDALAPNLKIAEFVEASRRVAQKETRRP
jgi:antitoxin ParD1/3/4